MEKQLYFRKINILKLINSGLKKRCEIALPEYLKCTVKNRLVVLRYLNENFHKILLNILDISI